MIFNKKPVDIIIVSKNGGAVAITERAREVITGTDLFKRLIEQIERSKRSNVQ